MPAMAQQARTINAAVARRPALKSGPAAPPIASAEPSTMATSGSGSSKSSAAKGARGISAKQAKAQANEASRAAHRAPAGDGVVTDDVVVKSPSRSASFTAGRNPSGDNTSERSIVPPFG